MGYTAQDKLHDAIKYINAGKDKTFDNWHDAALITKEEYIEGLRWLADDPMDDRGIATRELMLVVTEDMKNKKLAETNPKFASAYDENHLKGGLLKARRVYYKKPDQYHFVVDGDQTVAGRTYDDGSPFVPDIGISVMDNF